MRKREREKEEILFNLFSYFLNMLYATCREMMQGYRHSVGVLDVLINRGQPRGIEGGRDRRHMSDAGLTTLLFFL